MSFFVSSGFLLDTFPECLRQVHARLVGQADQYPEYVGHLFFQVAVFAFLERLVAVAAGHDTGQFATSSVRQAMLVSSLK